MSLGGLLVYSLDAVGAKQFAHQADFKLLQINLLQTFGSNVGVRTGVSCLRTALADITDARHRGVMDIYIMGI